MKAPLMGLSKLPRFIPRRKRLGYKKVAKSQTCRASAWRSHHSKLKHPLEAKPEPVSLENIPLNFQLSSRTLNVTIDTKFLAKYHSACIRVANHDRSSAEHRVFTSI